MGNRAEIFRKSIGRGVNFDQGKRQGLIDRHYVHQGWQNSRSAIPWEWLGVLDPNLKEVLGGLVDLEFSLEGDTEVN